MYNLSNIVIIQERYKLYYFSEQIETDIICIRYK